MGSLDKLHIENPDQLQPTDVLEAGEMNGPVVAADLAPAIGQVVCVDELTGRQIVRTSAYDGGRVFSTGFAPEKISEIFMPYDQ